MTGRDVHILYGFAVVAVLCVLAAGTAKVQLWPDRRIVQQSQKQYWANVAVSASRGRIEDRNGIPLAISVPTTSFFIDPKYWDPRARTSSRRPSAKRR